MNIAQYFTRRPIAAAVLSLLFIVAGAAAIFRLPIAEYPDVAPPSITIQAMYPGASPQTVSDTVAAPLEQQMTGIDGLLYHQSTASADGSLSMNLVFRHGTDMQGALVEVQNRIARTQARLPDEVRRLGITSERRSNDMVMVVHIVSPDSSRDALYLSNFATLHISDELKSIEGVGLVRVFGAGDYSLRLWLDPQALAARQLTAADVVRAVREQNAQIAGGSLGAQPSAAPFQMTVQVKGRLSDPEEFGNIALRTFADGRTIRLSEVARIELGAASYSLRAGLSMKSATGAPWLMNRPAAAVPIFQAPNSNALAISQGVRARLAELKQQGAFPDGVTYEVVYDPTEFISASIEKVQTTLAEAILFVLVVVLVFLQSWRAALIPLLAVPVSIVGTFAVMHVLGYSINNLSLFGLVLAIGIVVDDAIVVVENVERHIALGRTPREAALHAMREVTGPIIATALVLCAVFIPAAMVPGLTGTFYKQFAVTIAISTVISAINSLTLSPAMAALLLPRHGTAKDLVQRMIDGLLGWWLFRPFNAVFNASSNFYQGLTKGMIRLALIVVALFAGMLVLTGWTVMTTPRGFIPEQDKGYLMAVVMLPDGSSLERTNSAIENISAAVMKDPLVQGAVSFPGMGFGFIPNSSRGVVFIRMRPYAERSASTAYATALAGRFMGMAGQAAPDAFCVVLMPPPVMGLGSAGGFRWWIQDRNGIGLDALNDQVNGIKGAMFGQSHMFDGMKTFSTFQNNTPMVRLDINRERAQALGIELQEIAITLGGALGQVFINDFDLYGKTWQVNLSADECHRRDPSVLTGLTVRTRQGDLVPLTQVVTWSETTGPTAVSRYNGYPAIDLSAEAARGVTGSAAQAHLGEMMKAQGMSWEPTETALQEKLSSNSGLWLFPVCVLLVFLVLAWLYESWLLPLAVILIVPLCLLFALVGINIAHIDNNILVQIGLLVLVGLACKNAILIVEFARDLERCGRSKRDAILEACRLRLRPILMTSIAFIAGVIPLVITSGAGAEMRRAMGVAVFSGMIGVTIVGLLLTPVFYHLMRALGGNASLSEADDAADSQGAHHDR